VVHGWIMFYIVKLDPARPSTCSPAEQETIATVCLRAGSRRDVRARAPGADARLPANADSEPSGGAPRGSGPFRCLGRPGCVGLPPGSVQAKPVSPLMVYRWAHTDAALTVQLELEDEHVAGVMEPGHGAVRSTNPTTGADALTTMRTEFHRLRARAATWPVRTSASSVWQGFRRPRQRGPQFPATKPPPR
jgi:hypothetical protein